MRRDALFDPRKLGIKHSEGDGSGIKESMTCSRRQKQASIAVDVSIDSAYSIMLIDGRTVPYGIELSTTSCPLIISPTASRHTVNPSL